MATGKQRLEDKHKEKRKAATARIEKMASAIDAEKPKTRKRATGAEIIQFTKANKVIKSLKPEEKEYFEYILKEVKEIQPSEYEKFTLAAASLAKLYVQQDLLEAQIDTDGGYIQEDDKGRMYQHPAGVMLQRLQNTILRNLTALSLTMGKKQAKSEENNDKFESEFANFQ